MRTTQGDEWIGDGEMVVVLIVSCSIWVATIVGILWWLL